jgi:hypothetical protein
MGETSEGHIRGLASCSNPQDLTPLTTASVNDGLDSDIPKLLDYTRNNSKRKYLLDIIRNGAKVVARIIGGGCILFAVLYLLANYTPVPAEVFYLFIPLSLIWIAGCILWSIRKG